MRKYLLLFIIVMILVLSGCPGTVSPDAADTEINRQFDSAAASVLSPPAAAAGIRFAGEYRDETANPAAATASSAMVGTATADLLLDDQFDTFDTATWYAIEEKTNQSAERHLQIAGGQLVITTAETDRNPFLYSQVWPMPAGGTIRISRRARVSYANEYFAGGFFLMQTNDDSLIPAEGRTEEVVVGVQHLNFTYDRGRYPITTGFLAITPNYKADGQYAAITDAPFGQWIEEVLEYQPATGKATYWLNGTSYQLQSKMADQNWFRVSMNAYGWYTGHRAEVDLLRVEVLSDAGQAQARPEKLPDGYAVVQELFSTTAEPAETDTLFDAGNGLSVKLPPFALSQQAELKIESLAGSSDTLAAWKVTCGPVTAFDAFLEFSVPYPGAGKTGPAAADELIAVTWNAAESAWQQEYGRFESDRIVVLLDHLTTVALMPRGDAPSSQLKLELPDFLSAENFRDHIWEPFGAGHTWSSQAGAFTGLLVDFPLLEKLNVAMENLGYVVSLANIADKMMKDDMQGASSEAIKAAVSWTASSIGGSAMTIASLGIFAIDYSLSTFATTVLEADYQAFERAFRRANANYNKRSREEWIQVITNILRQAHTTDQAKNMFEAALNSYTTKLWQGSGSDMYDEFLIYVSEEKNSQGLTYLGGLNEQNQQRMSETWKAELYRDLLPLFSIIIRREQARLISQRPARERQLSSQLQKVAAVQVQLNGLPAGYEVQAALFHGQSALAAIGFQSGVSSLQVGNTMAHFLEKGAPDSIAIRVRYSDKGKTVYKNWFQQFSLRDWNSEVSFNLKELLAAAPEENSDEENDDEQPADRRGTEVPASLPTLKGGGNGGSWELVNDILTITRTSSEYDFSKPVGITYTLRSDFWEDESIYAGAEFISHTILEWSEDSPNASGVMRYKLVEEIKFRVQRPESGDVTLFMWQGKDGGLSVWKTGMTIRK